MKYLIAGSVQTEAIVVGIVCGVFLLLFIVAGIKQKMRDMD